MSIRETVESMPPEKQVAWGVRAVTMVAVTVVGTISWSAFTKLDGLVNDLAAQRVEQAAMTVKLDRLIVDDATRRTRLDVMQEQYYRNADRLRVLELRLDSNERRDAPPAERQ